MEIYAPKLHLIEVQSEKRRINVAGSSQPGRYRLDLAWEDDDPGSLIAVHLRDDDGGFAVVTTPVRPSRHCNVHGWDSVAVKIVGQSPTGKLRFCAYRLLATQTQGRDTLLVLSQPPSSDFMALLPDSTALGSVAMAGTHETLAFFGGPISQCQQPATGLYEQLESGIRFIDVRLKVVGTQLIAYHGPQSQRLDFPTILSTIHRFLQSHSGETLIMSIKEEIPPFHPRFSALVERDLTVFNDDWFLENRVPTLGEIRGKAILLSRFERVEEKEWLNGLGMHPASWPDSKPYVFEWDCSGTRVRVQDWYRVGSFIQIPEKYRIVVESLDPSLDAQLKDPSFTLSFASASNFPLALPTTMAKGFGWPSWGVGVRGINSRLSYWLLERICAGQKVKACILFDFYRQTGESDADLASIMTAMNFI
ncbi:PLC-like phosphodiesterase [Kockovaella imperatae]|uniref:PLC-like phosphodiesterase n=1 Tax=Kockovaella imperatae TaxID=4999 RepID=A0A1Y1U867_9TREE|nr:PLC-like phosphodiesterase [Kockovaella imperatae]ORX34208.1 PLC-like phosphodiesterase [Kockovaella imperatae]